ncbi:MAG: glycosyltransferase family 2 protein, partial [Hyphomicrobiales bacterium]|nr:glycosyltransferase family 2 protein [Hyphomicrobiales bacterium]
MSEPLVSILINNYNYAEYVGAAIDSALAQDYPAVEVLVVDDGSTDDSRHVISSYGDRIVPIFKQNGGQPSAFNAGVAASRGQILCFLDADDSFSPDKVRCVVETFRNEGLNSRPLMVHHLLAMRSDTDSELDGKPFGKTHQSPMNLQSFAQRHRFIWYEAGPTTAISLNRVLADRLFPIPEKGVRISGDDFIVSGAYLLG